MLTLNWPLSTQSKGCPELLNSASRVGTYVKKGNVFMGLTDLFGQTEGFFEQARPPRKSVGFGNRLPALARIIAVHRIVYHLINKRCETRDG